MTEEERRALERRVLVLAPTAKDAELTQSILARADIPCQCCADVDEICEQLAAGASALLFAEETVVQDSHRRLLECLNAQPRWSDLPVLVLARAGADSAAVAEAMDRLGNVTVLERPMRVAAFVSAVRTALRARERQYQTREHLREKEQSAETLRRHVEEMRALLDTLPIGVLIAHDPECRRITGNRAAGELLRMSPELNFSKSAEPRERPLHFTVRREGRELPASELPVQRAARGEPSRDVPIDLSFDDGVVTRALVSASPLYAPNGQVRGAVASVLDVTEQKRAEDALRDADRRKDEFLAILAHELRNPLAPIRNSLDVLRLSGKDEATFERVAEMMDRQVNYMMRLVDDLLEVSRITRGTIELRRERIDIADVVRSALETSRPLIDGAGHQLEVALPAERLVVDGDLVRLTQVFANLLNNAAKYMEPGGRLWLGVQHDAEWVSISVRDTGSGIPPEMLARIFDLFTQVDRQARGTQGGLGIGLTLVKSLVESHGGSVEARSEGLGRGSEFIVRLPLASDPRGAESPASKVRAPSSRAARRILVVDDNHDAAECLGMLLELLDSEVRVVHSGASALAELAASPPDIVLLDVGMPEMDGHEVARRIREQPEFDELTLVAVTGWGQDADRRRSEMAGFDHHLTKPADLEALQRLLASIEEKRGATRARS